MGGGEKETNGERERECLYPLVHSPNAYNRQGWRHEGTRIQNSALDSCTGDRDSVFQPSPLPPRLCIRRKLELAGEPDMGYRHLR